MRKFNLTRFSIVVLLLAIFTLGSASTKAPSPVKQGDYDYVKQYLSDYIEKEIEKHNVVGLSIALVDDQTIVWAQGFGYADKEAQIKASPETIYRVASISKLFTGTAVMQLAEQGKVDINKPFRNYLPEFSIKSRFPDAGPITPRNMMTHHSGLPADFFQGVTVKNPAPPSSIIPMLRDSYVKSPPNLAWSYSNLAVSLLGQMVEAVSGENFVTYMDKIIFAPMGMTNSSFELKPHMQHLLSKGYFKAKAQSGFGVRELAAANLYSNVLDLARFEMMVFAEGKSGENRILKPETLHEMLTVQNADVALDFDWYMGLSWFMFDAFGFPEEAGPVCWHGGDFVFYKSILVTLPKYKLGVIVLTNSLEGEKVLAEIASKSLKLMYEAKTGKSIKPAPFDPSKVVKMPEAELKKYVGMYDSMIGTFETKVKNGKLITKFMGAEIILIPNEAEKVAPTLKLFGFIPIKFEALVQKILPIPIENLYFTVHEINGRRVLALNNAGHRFLAGVKLDPVPIPDSWMRRLGRYEVTDKGDNLIYIKSVDIKFHNGFLIAEVTYFGGKKFKDKVAIEPVSDTEAVIMGIVRGRGDTLSITKSADNEILSCSGYHLRLTKRFPRP